MLTKICFSTLLCINCCAYSQTQEIDSILNLLNQHTAGDTTRLNLLNELSFQYAGNDSLKGLQYADQAITLANKLGNEFKLGQAYINKGMNHYYNMHYEPAEQEYLNALSIFERKNNKPLIANANYLLGYLYTSYGKTEKAIQNLESALIYYQATHDEVKIAKINNSMGGNYYRLSKFPQAIDYYFRSLAAYEKIKDTLNIALGKENIGMVFNAMGKFDTALNYYTQSLADYRKLRNKKREANALTNIGNVYDNKDETTRAIQYYRQAYSINLKENFRSNIAFTSSNLGIAYTGLKKYDSAFYFLLKELDFFIEVEDYRNESIIRQYLGVCIHEAPDDILIKYSFAPEKRFKLAEDMVRQSITLAEKAECVSCLAADWEVLKNVYAAANDFKNAYQAAEKEILFKDSVYSDENRDALANSKMQYEFDKEEAVLNAKHQAELARQKTVKNFLLTGGIFLLLVSAMIFFLYKRRSEARSKQREAELKAHVADTELKVMRLQMNPHFIFNSLNSISDYIRKNNPEEADEYLSKFARVMRMTLENSEQTTIALKEDLAMLELYMQLESKRLNHKFDYSIKVDPEIDQENTLVPPMIFQPFVENSIWHGLAKKEGKGEIKIDIQKDGEMLNCIIEDNGIGCKNSERQKPNEKKHSMGMKITKSRLDLLNRMQGTEATIQLIDKPDDGGVQAQVHLPLTLAF